MKLNHPLEPRQGLSGFLLALPGDADPPPPECQGLRLHSAVMAQLM